MKVKWLCNESRFIPGVGIAAPGAVIDMDADTAGKFVASGYAEPVTETPKRAVKLKVSDEGGEDK